MPGLLPQAAAAQAVLQPTNAIVVAKDELAFTGEAGSGVVFRSALWHRTERAGAGVWKLALFYGYLL